MAGSMEDDEGWLTLKFQCHWIFLWRPYGQTVHWEVSGSLREYFSNQVTIRVQVAARAGLQVRFLVRKYNVGNPVENQESRDLVDECNGGPVVLVPEGHVGEATFTVEIDEYIITVIASTV